METTGKTLSQALAAPAAPAEAETPVPGDAAPEPMEAETVGLRFWEVWGLIGFIPG